MSELKGMELSLDELETVNGGYKKPDKREGYKRYQIKQGDTLSKLADKFNCTVDDIIEWNKPKITNRNVIYAGDWLYIKVTSVQ